MEGAVRAALSIGAPGAAAATPWRGGGLPGGAGGSAVALICSLEPLEHV